MHFINLAVPSDFSYVKSDNSGTCSPADAADSVAVENVWPILSICLSFPSIKKRCGCVLRLHHEAASRCPSHGQRRAMGTATDDCLLLIFWTAAKYTSSYSVGVVMKRNLYEDSDSRGF